MKHAFVTGSKGFVGRYLVAELKNQGWKVYGFNLRENESLLNYEQLREKLNTIRPQRIFHLAAQAYVPESFTNPKRTFEVNTIGSLNLLEAVRQLGIKTRIHLAGTSEEYGDVDNGLVTEWSLPQPLSPYAISKLAMDHLGQLYSKSYGIPIVVTRAFNHAGPGRGEMYAESAFAKQIVEIERGTRKVLEHGNLNSTRNYTDVRDIVRAYMLAIELEPDVYNICSNTNISIQHLLNLLIHKAQVEIPVEERQSLYRPSDFSFKTPSCEKFHKLTGWVPQIDIDQTTQDILDDWRQRL